MSHTTLTNLKNMKKLIKLQNTSSKDSKPATDYGLAKGKHSKELSGSQ